MTTETAEQPVFEQPRFEQPRKPRLPEVQRRLEIAAGLRQEGEETIAKADAEVSAAKSLEQRLTALQFERNAVQARIENIEKQDFKARLEQCRATVRELYGIHNLGAGQIISLNEAGHGLAWLPEVAKEIPAIVKNLKARVTEIDKEIETLASK